MHCHRNSAGAIVVGKKDAGGELRGEIVRHGAKPVIPNNSSRVVIHRGNQRADGGRNVIERGCCGLEDCRRVAARSGKLAGNFLAAVHLAAPLACWLD